LGTIATIAIVAGDGVAAVAWVVLTDGLLAALWVGAAWLTGCALWAMVGRSGEAAGKAAPADLLVHVSWIALGLGAFALLVLGLGLLGWMNQVTAIGLPLIGAAAGGARIAQGRLALPEMAASAGPWRWLWLLAMPALGIAVVAATVPPGLLWPDDPLGYDVVEYHLQLPREWYEGGAITRPDHNVYGFFPFNLEMHFLAAMHIRGGPWAGMYLAQFISLAHGVLAVVAVYAAGRRLVGEVGDRNEHPCCWRWAVPILAAVAVAVAPWTGMLSSVAYNESALLLYGTLAVGWALRGLSAGRAFLPVPSQASSPPTGQTGMSVLLAGVMAGLACGTKYTAIPVVGVGLACVWTIFASVGRMKPAPILRGIGAFIAAMVLSLAPWLARNIAWSGNPVFPEMMSALGRGHFTPAQVHRWEQAHQPAPDLKPVSARLAALARETAGDARYGYVLFPAAIIALALGRRSRATWMILSLLGVLVVFWLALTHLQSRFFILALPLAAMALASVVWPRLEHIATAVLALVVTVGAAAGFAHLREKLSPMADAGAFGLDDYRPLLPADVRAAIDSKRPIDLVGDAKGFLYQVPMARLRYRTVFDVDCPPGSDIIDTWLGGRPRPGAIRIIWLSELRRFSRTYGTPRPPERIDASANTIVLP
jgi:hypothetical protein